MIGAGPPQAPAPPGRPRGEAESASRGAAADLFRFSVTMRKPPGVTLGIEVSWVSGPVQPWAGIFISKITDDGAIRDWNSWSQEPYRVRPGDLIYQVNHVNAEVSMAMIEEMQQNDSLVLHLMRSPGDTPPDQQAGGEAVGRLAAGPKELAITAESLLPQLLDLGDEALASVVGAALRRRRWLQRPVLESPPQPPQAGWPPAAPAPPRPELPHERPPQPPQEQPPKQPRGLPEPPTGDRPQPVQTPPFGLPQPPTTPPPGMPEEGPEAAADEPQEVDEPEQEADEHEPDEQAAAEASEDSGAQHEPEAEAGAEASEDSEEAGTETEEQPEEPPEDSASEEQPPPEGAPGPAAAAPAAPPPGLSEEGPPPGLSEEGDEEPREQDRPQRRRPPPQRRTQRPHGVPSRWGLRQPDRRPSRPSQRHRTEQQSEEGFSESPDGIPTSTACPQASSWASVAARPKPSPKAKDGGKGASPTSPSKLSPPVFWDTGTPRLPRARRPREVSSQRCRAWCWHIRGLARAGRHDRGFLMRPRTKGHSYPGSLLRVAKRRISCRRTMTQRSAWISWVGTGPICGASGAHPCAMRAPGKGGPALTPQKRADL
ncbi:unnamed protein product [Prorocentrum cordatum]|uniref:PDZ domain-containing protein n=1 Tax=Prorocentrum cordatum TaxID=2364126 RepID=A0ABN9XII1_9DINO|nr:unnamed protein product [Polarella glacialis]